MKTLASFRNVLLVLMAAAMLVPASASACAICYGEPGSPMTRGLTWAILALVMVVAIVLSGVVAFFVRTLRNESAQPPVNPTTSHLPNRN